MQQEGQESGGLTSRNSAPHLQLLCPPRSPRFGERSPQHHSSHHHLGAAANQHHHHALGHLKVVRSREAVHMDRRGSLPAAESFGRDQTSYLVQSAASLQDVAPLLELPAPPDGGWGWMVVAASFLCNVVLDGIAYSFGVSLPYLAAHYGPQSAAALAWVGSLLAGIYQICGPVAGGLVNKFGCRAVCMAGGVVSCGALLLSVRCSNVLLLALTYGVLGGFGLGLVYLPAVTVVGYYFEKRRALATGVAVCGSGVGTFTFAPLATFLLGRYGWQGTNVIFAGLCLNCCVFGALMRPLELVIEPPADVGEESGGGKRKKGSSRLQDVNPASSDPEYRLEVQLPDGTRGSMKRGSIASGASGALGLPKIPSIILTPHHSLSLLNEEIAEEDDGDEGSRMDDDDDGFEDGTPMTMVARTSIGAASASAAPPRRRTYSESPSPLLKNVLSPSAQLTTSRNNNPPQSIKRNVSTPGLGRLSRMSASHTGVSGGHGAAVTLEPPEPQQDHVIFGVDEGSQMMLRPSTLGERTAALVRPMSRKDVFYGGSVLSLVHGARRPESPPQQRMLDRYRHSVIAMPKDCSHPLPRGSVVASHLSIAKAAVDPELVTLRLGVGDSLTRVLREMVDVRVCKNPLFILFSLAHFLGFLALYVPFVYLPTMMVSLSGRSLSEASWVISAVGIFNTAGRVVVGWAVDRFAVSALLVTNASLVSSAACIAALLLCSTFYEYLAVGCLLGLSISAFISLTSIVLVELLGLDTLTASFGLVSCFRGVSAVLGPPLAGIAFHATQEYRVVFAGAAALFLAAAVCAQTAYFWHAWRRRNGKNK